MPYLRSYQKKRHLLVVAFFLSIRNVQDLSHLFYRPMLFHSQEDKQCMLSFFLRTYNTKKNSGGSICMTCHFYQSLIINILFIARFSNVNSF